ncbi:hypothetical protein PybrP1_010315 [[Pythium] brassicae (nom. inval.)]|nr:hypothetical protein PybrP1_010315 [[Pythium] brassicae (nom. inval.)]
MTEPWDISRLGQPWAIDTELRRRLPALARAKRGARESAADKFLRLSRLPLPAEPSAESLLLSELAPLERRGSQRAASSAAQLTPEAKARYFGTGARAECHAIFRKLAAQKYLACEPLSAVLDGQQARGAHEAALLGPRTAVTPLSLDARCERVQGPPDAARLDARFHPVDRLGLFSRQFTARHRFSALCLEQDLPPCIRLIVRNYLSPEINVSHMAIGDALAGVFAQCLRDLPMVTGLNVRNNRLGDAGLRALVDVVVAKPDLFHLDLSENKCGGAAAAALAGYLGSAACTLQTLKLSRADVDDAELAPFARALHANRSLRTLELSRNLVGSSEHLNVVRPSITTGGEALATMLSINYTLTALDLSWNYLRLGGAVELGRALAYNSGLRALNLAYNAFGDAGAQAIGEALLANATLERLDLSHNNIPAHGAMALASAVKRNRALLAVNVDGNPLGQAGGRALLHAVAACGDRQLAVSMEGCNFDLADADAFDPAESTGAYDLNMEVPYERAVALELLRVANTKQGCKFLSLVHVTGAARARRAIKLELREVDGSDARRRLLKTAGILTASRADEQEMKAYKLDRASLVELFRELDKDGSGSVDDAELKLGMHRLGLSFRDDDIPRFIAQYDLDGTGTIELDEFVDLMASLNLEDGHFARECVDVQTNLPFEIPTEGRLLIEFVDLHVSVDHDNAHSHAGVERLIENISASKNKSQMLAMAKSGLFFKAGEAQLLLDAVAELYEPIQAVQLLLPNMVSPKEAHALIDHNLNAGERVRLQHLMGQALDPMLGMGSGHYRLDLSAPADRATMKRLIEDSNRTCFLRKKAGLKDTSQHGNHHGFRNETLNGKPAVLTPQFLDAMPKFGLVEFDYVQLGRAPQRPVSASRFEQMLAICQLALMGPPMGVRTRTASPDPRRLVGSRAQGTRGKGGSGTTGDVVSPFPPLRPFTRALFAELESMKSVKHYLKFGDELNRAVELRGGGGEPDGSRLAEPPAVGNDTDGPVGAPAVGSSDTAAPPTLVEKRSATDSENRAAMVVQRDGRATCTARRLLYTLRWLLATRWVSAPQAVRLLGAWPAAFEGARVELACLLFDRLADLHNAGGLLAALGDAEAAQCLFRLGWLNLWTPLLPDNYYELSLALYEEREVAKALVRLAIDEPGENWQGETFGWSRDELIPGWELNLSWLKDGGFPDKGCLCLEYYSGADKGCGPVWPTRRELAAGTLAGLPADAEMDELAAYVDALSLVPASQRRR